MTNETKKPERPDPYPTAPVMSNKIDKDKSIRINKETKKKFDSFKRKLQKDSDKTLNASETLMYLIDNVQGNVLVLSEETFTKFKDFKFLLEKNLGRDFTDIELVGWLIKNR